MSDLEKVQETVTNLVAEWAQYKTANDARLEEIKTKGFESAETKERFAKMDTAMDGLHEYNEKVKAEFEKATELKGRVDLLETSLRRPRSTGVVGVEGDPRWSLPEYVEHKEMLDKWLRYGSSEHPKSMSPEEMKKLGQLELKTLRTSSDPDGGYALTPEREAGIIDRVRETSPMRQVAAVTSIGVDTWEQMRITGHTSSGAWVSEQGTRSATGTPTFGMVSIPVHEQYEMPPVTQKMLDDANFNVESFLGDEVSMSMSIRENTAFITGTGAGQPRGIMTYTSGTDDTLFQVEQTVTGHASQVTADGFITCQDALFEPYQPGARWLMRRATRSEARKLKYGTGNYLLQVDFSAGGAATILGAPVTLCSDIAAIAGSALVAAYGNFQQAYRIIDRIGIRVLRDPYSSKPNVLFYTTKRTGGGVVRPQAYKIMVVSA